MAILDTDVSVNSAGDIRWTGGGATTYTVLELHRWLQDKADNASYSGDDVLDITDGTPSDRSTDNIITLLDHSATAGPTFNIDDTMAEHLYDGSISQNNGDVVYSGLRVLGAVNDTNTQLMVIQSNELYQFTTTPASPFWGTQSAGGLNGDATAGILMRCLIKSRTFGVDIDGKRIRVQARHWGDSYDFFNVTLGQGESVAAISTTPDAQNTTLQATATAYTHVTNTEGYQTIDLSNGNGAQPYYSQWTYGADTSGDQLKAVWEFTKDLTGNGTAKTIHGLNGELFLGVTHSFPYDGETGGNPATNDIYVWGTKIDYTGETNGPFVVGDAIHEDTATPAWKGRILSVDDNGTTGTLIVEITSGVVTTAETFTVQQTGALPASATVSGTPTAVVGGGVMNILAADVDGTATGNLYVQVLEGNPPANDNIVYKGLDTSFVVVVNGTVSSKTVPKHFLGSYTGSIIGAYGIGIASSDLINTDSVTDLLGVTQPIPNNVTFSVTAVISGEDYILVGPRLNGILNTEQIIGAVGQNTTGAGTYVTGSAIPSDTPASGVVRVFNGFSYDRVEYASYTGSTFTLVGTLPSEGVNLQFGYDTLAVSTFQVGETVTIGGLETAEIVRNIDNGDATGTLYVRMLTGAIGGPANNDTLVGGTSTATANINVDDAVIYPLTTPKQTGGFISYIDKLANIYTVKTAMTSATQTTCVVSPNIAVAGDNAVPQTGTIRVLRDNDTTVDVAYSAHDNVDTFTITSTDFSAGGAGEAAVGNEVYEVGGNATTSETFTSVFNTARDLFVRVRDGGTSPIKTFESPASLGGSGGSVAAIRTADA